MSSTQTSQVSALVDALAGGNVEIVDLTQPLSESTPVIKLPPPFANTPGLSREEISRYDDRGPAWAWYTLTIGEHVGTHLDAPIHWVTGKDGDDVASVSPVLSITQAGPMSCSGFTEATSLPSWPVTQWIGASRCVPTCSPIVSAYQAQAGPRSS